MNVRKLIVATILTFAFALTLSVAKGEGDTETWKIQKSGKNGKERR